MQLKSELLVFNGGDKGGKTTLLIHAFLATPVTASLVTDGRRPETPQRPLRAEIGRDDPEDRQLPGSVKNFNLTINKKGYLLAKCPDGHIDAQGEAIFKDGTEAKGAVTRPCTPEGLIG